MKMLSNRATGSLRVREALPSDRDEMAKMQSLLWPGAAAAELRAELDAVFGGRAPGALPLVILVSCDEQGALTGFIEVGLRSHADGCDPTRPVGFVEGWFVHEPCRNTGVGKRLMRDAEEWARQQGCEEMASDALIENEGSQRAHEALGFEVVDRCVHYRKKF